MTIQRKYQLPNCTLLLEGLSESINTQEAHPVMTILVSAECRLLNSKHLLSGGRDFFESLVTAVSGYAQEFLSHVPHLEAHNKESGLVQLEKIDADRHRLVDLLWKPHRYSQTSDNTPTTSTLRWLLDQSGVP